MIWKWILPILFPFAALAIERQFTRHTSQITIDQEFENIEKTVQSKTIMSTRIPVNTDKSEEGTFWYRTSTNKLFIREKVGWTQLN